MLTKAILALLAAFGIDSTAPVPEHGGTTPGGDHFCCKSVGAYDNDCGAIGYGAGCTHIAATNVSSCAAVLFCPGGYTNDQGAVKCPL